jgi:hypothetical protein
MNGIDIVEASDALDKRIVAWASRSRAITPDAGLLVLVGIMTEGDMVRRDLRAEVVRLREEIDALRPGTTPASAT